MVSAASLGAERRSERASTELTSRWLRREGEIDVSITDINLHGMFLSTTTVASVGSLLRLEVVLDEGAPLKMFVRVCHLEQTSSGLGMGMGVEIYLLGPEEHLRWMHYYRRLVDANY